MRIQVGIVWIVLAVCVSCTQYTPKPRGYFRIEPDSPKYQLFTKADLPYAFHISQLVVAETDTLSRGLILSYPDLNAKVYCSYLTITPSTLEKAEEESRALVVRQSKRVEAIKEQMYSNPEEQVFGSLFILDEESVSPVQFMLTDSVSRFFRGALYYDCIPNADSLAPVNRYLERDMIELIQTFRWNK